MRDVFKDRAVNVDGAGKHDAGSLLAGDRLSPSKLTSTLGADLG